MREIDSYLHWCTVSVNLSRPSELLLRFYITHTTMKAQFKQQNSLGQKGDFSFSQKFEVNLWTSEETIFHTIASPFECSIFVLAWLQLRLNDCEIEAGLEKKLTMATMITGDLTGKVQERNYTGCLQSKYLSKTVLQLWRLCSQLRP